MLLNEEDLRLVLTTDALTDEDFDPNVCLEALVALSEAVRTTAANELEADNVMPLIVMSALVGHLDRWLSAGRPLPHKWAARTPAP